MKTCEILSDLINDDAQEEIDFTNNKETGFIKLLEPDQPESSVTIKGLPAGSFAIKLDAFPAPQQFFKGSNGECKRADYAIFSTIRDKKYIFIIELKKSNANKEHHIVQQLRGGYCCTKYLQEIAKQFWQESDFLDSHEYRYIAFLDVNTRLRKRPTKLKIETLHDKPECPLKIKYAKDVHISKVLGVQYG